MAPIMTAINAIKPRPQTYPGIEPPWNNTSGGGGVDCASSDSKTNMIFSFEIKSPFQNLIPSLFALDSSGGSYE